MPSRFFFLFQIGIRILTLLGLTEVLPIRKRGSVRDHLGGRETKAVRRLRELLVGATDV